MAECIEREKVYECLNVISNDIEDIPEHGLPKDYIEGWQNALETAIDMVENIPPAADVRPERHGRWTDTGINLYDGSSERGYQCNVCKDIFFVEQSEIAYYKFCPHCKAKMDGKDGE